jgi:hypothetical protein
MTTPNDPTIQLPRGTARTTRCKSVNRLVGKTFTRFFEPLSLGSWIVGSLGVLVATLCLIGGSRLSAQDPPKVKPSQHGTVSQRIADTTITVEYNRPVARGRELFGRLVPYGRIWCPCADDATTVEVSTGVTVEGKELAAGRYSLWTEPEPERWTVIFKKHANAWHTRYPEGHDALRIQVTPRTGSHMETLAFYFPVVDGKKAELALHWGSVVVPLKIEVP